MPLLADEVFQEAKPDFTDGTADAPSDKKPPGQKVKATDYFRVVNPDPETFLGSFAKAAVEPFKALAKSPSMVTMDDDSWYEEIQKESVHRQSVGKSGLGATAGRIAGSVAGGVAEFTGSTLAASETGPAAPFVGPAVAFGASGSWESAINAGVRAYDQGLPKDKVVGIAKKMAGVGAATGAGTAVALGATGLIPRTATALARTGATAAIGAGTGVGSQLIENVAEKDMGLDVSPTEGLLEQAVVMGLLPVVAHAKDLYRQARSVAKSDPAKSKALQQSADDVAGAELDKIATDEPAASPEALATATAPTKTPQEVAQAATKRRIRQWQEARRAEIKAAKPTVPETPAEPEADKGISVIDEIKQGGARTVADIQRLFPQAQLSREAARKLRDQAWGTSEAQAPKPKPAEAPPETPEDLTAQMESETGMNAPNEHVTVPVTDQSSTGSAPNGEPVAPTEPVEPKGKEANALVTEAAQPVQPVREQSVSGKGEVPNESRLAPNDEGRGEASQPETPAQPTTDPPTITADGPAGDWSYETLKALSVAQRGKLAGDLRRYTKDARLTDKAGLLELGPKKISEVVKDLGARKLKEAQEKASKPVEAPQVEQPDEDVTTTVTSDEGANPDTSQDSVIRKFRITADYDKEESDSGAASSPGASDQQLLIDVPKSPKDRTRQIAQLRRLADKLEEEYNREDISLDRSRQLQDRQDNILRKLHELESQSISESRVGSSAKPSLLEFAKSKLHPESAAKVTNESQAESFRSQWEKEVGVKPQPPSSIPTPPEVDFQHPAEGSPEANSLNDKASALQKQVDEAYSKMQQFKEQANKSGYGTKRKAELEAKAEKAREQYDSLSKQYEPIREQRYQMTLEHVVRNGPPEAKLAAAVELLQRRKSPRFREESDKAYKALRTEAENRLVAGGVDSKTAEHEALGLVSSVMSYPASEFGWFEKRIPGTLDRLKEEKASDDRLAKAKALLEEYGVLHSTGFEAKVKAARDDAHFKALMDEERSKLKNEQAAMQKVEAEKAEILKEQISQELENAKQLQKEGKLFWRRWGEGTHSRWSPIEAKAVSLETPGDFFIYRGEKGWVVVESSTGLSVGNGKLRADAITDANLKIQTVGAEKFQKVVSQKAKEAGPKPDLSKIETKSPAPKPPEPPEPVEAKPEAAPDKGNPLNTYLDSLGLDPMRRGKVETTLTQKVSKQSKDKTYTGTRDEVVRQMLSDGYVPKTEEVDAVKDVSRVRYNRMDGREQEAYEKRKAEAGKKTEYHLEKPDGSFFEVTKAEYDLATTLSNKPSAAEPASDQKYRIGNNPSTYSLIERLPQSETEKANGEQPVRVKNDRTGVEETVFEQDLKPVQSRTQEEKASAKESKRDLDAELREAKMDPSVFPDDASKRGALRRAKAKAEEPTKKGPGIVGMGGATPADLPKEASAIRTVMDAAGDGLRKLRSTIAHSWVSGDIRRAFASTRDAGDTAASLFGRKMANEVRQPMLREYGKSYQQRAEDGLTFAVEAKGDINALNVMRDKILNSDKANPSIKRRAVGAIDFAFDQWETLQKHAEKYKAITDYQVQQENAKGIDTLLREGYVMHEQDVEFEPSIMTSRSGTGDATGFRKVREHDTYADSIAAGIDPKSLNAVDLLQARVRRGQQLINKRAWVDGLKTFIDPISHNPIATDPSIVTRADGSKYPQAPDGYTLEMIQRQPIAIHKGYEGIISALTDPSAFSRSLGAQSLMKWAGAGKTISLMFDTFHLGRVAFWDSLIKATGVKTFRLPFPSYRKGLTLADYTTEQIRTMAAHGEIPADWVTGLEQEHSRLGHLVKGGYNIGRISDSLYQDFIHNLPVIGKINRWIFESFQRGAMAETGLLEFERLKSARPDMPDADVGRQVARDLNTRFGNLGRQGLLKSRTFQDLARFLVLAPQWNEGLIRSELGAGKQAIQMVADLARGKSLYSGVLLRSVGGMALAQFTANQIINYITRGHPTWENPEEGLGAKLSAWIPDKLGSGSGFFLHPLGLAAETTHLLMRKFEQTGDFHSSLMNYLRSRSSTAMRPMMTFITNQDFLGRNLKPGTVWAQMAADAIPRPIGGQAYTLGFKQLVTRKERESFAGQFEKQILSSVGIKTEGAPAPASRISSLAREFNRQKGIVPSAEFYSGDYQPLTSAVALGNEDAAKDAMTELLKRKTPEQVRKYMATWTGHPFTGQRGREAQFRATLTPEQKEQYSKAIEQRRKVAQEVFRMLRDKQQQVRLRPAA